VDRQTLAEDNASFAYKGVRRYRVNSPSDNPTFLAKAPAPSKRACELPECLKGRACSLGISYRRPKSSERHRSLLSIIISGRKAPEVLKSLSGNLRELRGPDGTRSKETTGMARHRDRMRLSRTGLGHQGWGSLAYTFTFKHFAGTVSIRRDLCPVVNIT
jgi:hypothetical protein